MWNNAKQWVARWSPEENLILFGLLLLIGLLLVRWLFLRWAVNATKALGPQSYREVRRLYATRSVLGWIFFAFAVAVVEVHTLYPDFLPTIITRKRVICGTVLFFLSGVFLHMNALVRALTHYILERGEREV